MNYYAKRRADAVLELDALLALPDIPAEDGLYSDGECFNPWDLFPAIYGTYSSAFDDLAVDVLSDIRDRTFNRTDLAAEMFREMLCTKGLCEYGTSPRVCFPEPSFQPRLPRLIERWRKFREIKWNG